MGCTFTAVTAGSTLTGTAPLLEAPAICFVIWVTKGPGISMPRRLIALMAYSAVPGFPIETVPAIRSGSCAPNMPANGPSVPGGNARVSSRA